MAVVIRRVFGTPTSSLTGTAGQDKILNTLQSSLSSVLDDAQNKSECVYSELVSLALAVVAVAQKGPMNAALQRLVPKAATMALSIVSALHGLIADFDDMIESEHQYINALTVHINDMTRVLVEVHKLSLLALGPSTPSRILDGQAAGLDKQLQNAYSGFSFKMAFFMSDDTVAARRASIQSGADGHRLVQREVTAGNALPNLPAYDFAPLHGIVQRFQRESFWDNTRGATVKGMPVVIKAYPLDMTENFRRDLKVLKEHRHSNLPSLFGYSSGNVTSPPFIALSMETFTPILDYLPLISASSPNSALDIVWKMLITMRTSADHLVQTGVVNQYGALRRSLETAVVDATGKVILAPTFDSEDKSITRDEIPRLFDFIHHRRETNGATFFNTDPLPRNLRPLYYALIENASETLHPSFSRLNTEHHPAKSVLARWRPGAASSTNRSLSWPIQNDISVAVGDIGRFVVSQHGGHVDFERIANIQAEIGGYILETQGTKEMAKRISKNIWRLQSTWKSPRLSQLWITTIPMDVALNYLSANATPFANRMGCKAEEVVLVTRIAMQLAAKSSGHNAGSFVIAEFDDSGRIYSASWSSALGNSRPQVYPAIDPTISVNLPNPPSFIQVEEDELKDASIPSDGAHGKHIATSLGDIGYFVTDHDGRKRFQVLHNSLTDLIEIEVSAWEGNVCERVLDGIWRSPIIQWKERADWCFSWVTSASSGLPHDLEPLYVHQMATVAGISRLPKEVEFHFVKQVSHQVDVSISQKLFQPFNGYRLFVHFDIKGLPYLAYLSSAESHIPEDENVRPVSGCVVSIRANLSNGLQYRSPMGFKAPHLEYSKLQPVQNYDSYAHRLGDIGILECRGTTKKWAPIHTESKYPRDAKHSWTIGLEPCREISDGLWQARCSSMGNSAHYRWSEDIKSLPYEAVNSISEMVADQQDVFVVTSLTTDVHVTFTDHSIFGELILYVLLPPEGGCYAYFSAEGRTSINKRIISKLDLQNWRIPGCDISISFTVERKPLAGLEECYRSTPPLFGLRIGDVGHDFGLSEGLEGAGSIKWLANIIENAVQPYIEHGSYIADDVCTEVSPGLWLSEPCGLRSELESALQHEYELGPAWWWSVALDDEFYTQDISDFAGWLANKHGVDVQNLRICTRIDIDVGVGLPDEVGEKEASTRLVGQFEEDPSISNFYWCNCGPEPCDSVSHNHAATPKGFSVKIRKTPVIEQLWSTDARETLEAPIDEYQY